MNSNKIPRMMSINQVAATGLLPECTLRAMDKAGRLPAVKVGKKTIINFDLLLEQLQKLDRNESVRNEGNKIE